jgi:hypothetical protein
VADTAMECVLHDEHPAHAIAGAIESQDERLGLYVVLAKTTPAESARTDGRQAAMPAVHSVRSARLVRLDSDLHLATLESRGNERTESVGIHAQHANGCKGPHRRGPWHFVQ